MPTAGPGGGGSARSPVQPMPALSIRRQTGRVSFKGSVPDSSSAASSHKFLWSRAET